MTSSFSRRGFIAAAPALWMATASHPVTAALLGPDVAAAARARSAVEDPAVYDEFPAQDPARVRETVAVSHGNFDRVRELVEASPALAKANWDWGFGDWESALGAASHTGNGDIAEFLVEHGARPTLFSATMLGQLDVVQAFVTASPGAQRIPGPHGITLLFHAKQGGERARPVLEYLESLGDADIGPQSRPLSPEDRQRYVGFYAFGSQDEERLEIYERNDRLWFRRGERTARGLTHLGAHEFHPSGAPAVRIRIAFGNGAPVLTVHDPDVVVRASKTG